MIGLWFFPLTTLDFIHSFFLVLFQRVPENCTTLLSSLCLEFCQGVTGGKKQGGRRDHPFVLFSEAWTGGVIFLAFPQPVYPDLSTKTLLEALSSTPVDVTWTAVLLLHVWPRPTRVLLCVSSLLLQLADIVADSFCRGVFGGDCRKLSLRSCFPRFYNAEQRRGSLILGLLLDSGEPHDQPAETHPLIHCSTTSG